MASVTAPKIEDKVLPTTPSPTMASVTAPKIEDKVLPATPSNEWANDTLDAAQSNADRVVTSSTTSTPGLEVPGGFPRDPRGQSSPTDGPGVVERAKQYIPAQGDVEQVLKSVGETAKQYLPQSLTSYFPGSTQTSLPSQENELTRSDGVGSLPGNASESAVALLPEERNPTKTSLPSRENELTRSDGVGSLPGNASESAVALLPEERNPTKTSLPSQENELTRSDGAGSLPGNASESAVALLPEERNPTKTSLPSQEYELTRSDGVGSLPGNASESTVALLPDERSTPKISDDKPLDTSALTPSTNPAHHSISNVSTLAQDGSESGKSTPGAGLKPSLTPSVLSNATTTNMTAGTPSGGSEPPTSASIAPGEELKEKQEPISNEGPALNLTPRTHPLASNGAQWQGVPLDEEYQRQKMDGGTVPPVSSLAVEADEKAKLGSTPDASSSTLSESLIPPPSGSGPDSAKNISKIASVASPSQAKASSSSPSTSAVDGSQSRFTEHDGTNSTAAHEGAIPVTYHSTQGSVGSKGSLEESQGSAGSTGSVGKRSNFLNKIKGEVKVISGKLGGKEEKVEEGRRLMRGET